jgi:hypothetical protein
VRIHRIELSAAERSAAVPPDTAAVPFEAWINGWLEGQAVAGDSVEIRTVTGRLLVGELVQTGPGYQHTFGSPPRSLQVAGEQAFTLIEGGDERH